MDLCASTDGEPRGGDEERTRGKHHRSGASAPRTATVTAAAAMATPGSAVRTRSRNPTYGAASAYSAAAATLAARPTAASATAAPVDRARCPTCTASSSPPRQASDMGKPPMAAWEDPDGSFGLRGLASLRASRTVARLTGALLVAVVAAGLTGCARQVTGPSLVLRLATPDRQTDATGPQVAHFAEEVSRRSGGSIRIDPVWDVTPDGAPTGTGRWRAASPTGPGRWGWCLAGPGTSSAVDSLRALNTPFLITSQAALRSVLDSDLRGDLLAGLPAAGVTGLDLFPDQLRHPFGYDRALLGADDYTGQSIRAPTSDTVNEVFAALDATTTDDDPDSGTQRGDESSYSLAQGHIATGNVTLYPKTDALVITTAVRHRLRDDQWSLLTKPQPPHVTGCSPENRRIRR